MNPPQHTAVFCVEEKTAIQAFDRLDPLVGHGHPGGCVSRLTASTRTLMRMASTPQSALGH